MGLAFRGFALTFLVVFSYRFKLYNSNTFIGEVKLVYSLNTPIICEAAISPVTPEYCFSRPIL